MFGVIEFFLDRREDRCRVLLAPVPHRGMCMRSLHDTPSHPLWPPPVEHHDSSLEWVAHRRGARGHCRPRKCCGLRGNCRAAGVFGRRPRFLGMYRRRAYTALWDVTVGATFVAVLLALHLLCEALFAGGHVSGSGLVALEVSVWVWGVGCWVLGVGCWVLGVGCWVWCVVCGVRCEGWGSHPART
jgi:hypothetical protein